MRFQRLLLEAGAQTVTVDLHPRLTIIAGVGDLERESLVTELLGGLAGSRPGTHLEVVEDTGRRLGVMHPASGARDRVVELAGAIDVTEEFLTDDGNVDLLAPMGMSLATAKRRCRMSSQDMVTEATMDSTVGRLATIDQDILWRTAEELRISDAVLKAEVAAIGADPEDTPLFEEIERRHGAFEAAQVRLEYVRHHGIFVGGACVIGAIPAAALRHWASVPLLFVAITTTLVSIAYRRRMEKARKAERKALDAAGADTYLSFRLQRMNSVFDGGTDRSRLALAVAEHREALHTWQRLVGDLSVDLAYDLRDRVGAASRRLREAGTAPGQATAAAAEPAELAQAFIVRMSELRHAGGGSEALPLLLDEPLIGVPPSVKQWVLELVSRSAGSPQIIYLTDDPDIAAWARMEAISGELSILEPAPAQESADVRL
jgi:hypothetical protein